ncbi:hypothetical protein MTR62_00600 [Novosphingobium sp. 1949]|uniref:DUF4148 domain-containing protein n=1 Tax=Novosphingobium organovorum TaxID=2930092 RepID=A0ABT0B8M6_9SPHN|nr:hypothetical protein [Novosphingobium organovorum]MCJ2181215.1 hypothetical protein [Novosphingobium organovorum]
MKQTKIFRTAAIAAAMTIPASMAVAAVPMTHWPMTAEQQMAQTEETRIITAPLGGIQNSKWYDYRINVDETKKELASDLRRASDLEDARDAYGEYAHELQHNRVQYVKYMAKKGVHVPRVYFEN